MQRYSQQPGLSGEGVERPLNLRFDKGKVVWHQYGWRELYCRILGFCIFISDERSRSLPYSYLVS